MEDVDTLLAIAEIVGVFVGFAALVKYQLLLLFCIVGVWTNLAPAFYLTAIVIGIFQVIVIFADLMISLLRRGRP